MFNSPPLAAAEIETWHDYALGLKDHELLGCLLEL